MVTRSAISICLVAVSVGAIAIVWGRQPLFPADSPSNGERKIVRLDGVSYPRTDSDLQKALDALTNSCGSVALPPNISIDITVTITIPSCHGETNSLSGSGNTTVLNFTNAAARVVQSSGTKIENLKIVSAQTTSANGGEVYSEGTTEIEASGLTFFGGGSHIAYKSVSNFTVSETNHLSLTAKGNAILLQGCHHGSLLDIHARDFTAPASDTYYGGAIRVGNGSSQIRIVNPTISNIDGTTVRDYAGVDISASHNVSIQGGTLTGLKNGDGVVTEDGATDVTISGTVSTGNSDSAGVGPYGNNGDGFDIYNSARVHISNCVGSNNGNLASNLQRGAEIFTSEDVTISKCEFSENGAQGIIVVGAPRTQLNGVTANGNRMAGVYLLKASGTVSVDGAKVALTDGTGFGLAWEPGTVIQIHSIQCQIASVSDRSHLVLTADLGAMKSVTYAVQSYEAGLNAGTYNNNGTGGKMVEGIYLADSTNATISDVTATDNRSSGKTQMWGANIQNRARAIFYRDNFLGNGNGEIHDAVGMSQEFDMVESSPSSRCCGSGKPQ